MGSLGSWLYEVTDFTATILIVAVLVIVFEQYLVLENEEFCPFIGKAYFI